MLARTCRGVAIALAAIAIVDPRVPLPQRSRPSVRVFGGADRASAEALRRQLAARGFGAAGGQEVATIAARDATIDRVPATPLYVLDHVTPDVAIRRAVTSSVRAPGQSTTVSVAVRGRGVGGRTTELRLEDAGLTVATVSHRWSGPDETWQASLSYLPAQPGAIPLRVRAETPGDRDAADDRADVLAPAERGPIRALVYAPTVTWPAVFVRRALEADAAFSVASLQRVTKSASIRAGAPPAALSRAQLEPYEVLLLATMDLDAASRDAVRWFVEERGGVSVFVPDRTPSAAPLLAGISFEPRRLETPERLKGESAALRASEVAKPRGLPALAQPLASDAGGAPIVFALRRGLGAFIVSGAIDAWRYRDAEGFDRFWPAAILAQAVAAPPRLEVTTHPAVVRPGDAVRITATLRQTEVPADFDGTPLPPAIAHAVAPGSKSDVPIRLWPTATPGRYEGEWHPAIAGEYAIDVAMGSLTAAAVLAVDDAAAAPPEAADAAAIAAQASGGGVFSDESSLMQALGSRFPRRTGITPAHPARSPWWAGGFVLLLCVEWTRRRRRGLA